eukprot:2356896-Amphidinium_carterae.1
MRGSQTSQTPQAKSRPKVGKRISPGTGLRNLQLAANSKKPKTSPKVVRGKLARQTEFNKCCNYKYSFEGSRCCRG